MRLEPSEAVGHEHGEGYPERKIRLFQIKVDQDGPKTLFFIGINQALVPGLQQRFYPWFRFYQCGRSDLQRSQIKILRDRMPSIPVQYYGILLNADFGDGDRGGEGVDHQKVAPLGRGRGDTVKDDQIVVLDLLLPGRAIDLL